MKTKIILALFSLGLLFGCNKPGTDGAIVDGSDTLVLDGGWDALHYLLAMEVVDQNGNNVLTGEEPFIVVEDAFVKVRHIENDVLMNCELIKSYVGGVNYFIVQVFGKEMVFLPDAQEDANLVSEIKCEEVFGDQEIHIIEAKWEKKKSHPLVCTSLEFEGKTYCPSPQNGFMSTARVVVNR